MKVGMPINKRTKQTKRFSLYNIPLEMIKSLYLCFRRKLTFHLKNVTVFLFMGDTVFIKLNMVQFFKYKK